ncbi:MAG: FAD:protein FMN transferase [Candidatus Limnocylindrales bacterium]
MGSPLRLTVVGAAEAEAQAAWEAVMTEFEAAERAMSRYRPSSDLCALNRRAGSGEPIPVERRLRIALAAADRAGRVTRGRFDARVLADLERLGRSDAPAVQTSLPAESTAARRRPDRAGSTRWLNVVGRSARIALSERIDLDGIGKGLALRWAWHLVGALLEPGVGALLEAGGDIVACSPSPDAGPWRIAIEDPTVEISTRPDDGAGSSSTALPQPMAVVGLDRGAITTSSTAVNRWVVDGRVVHHLIDPATGEPGGAGLLAVTVSAIDPAWAEVWSKSLFLAGRAGIAAEARRRGLAAWWVATDGSIEMTPAARLVTVWSASDS